MPNNLTKIQNRDRDLAWLVLRQLLPIVAVLTAAWVLRDRVSDFDVSAIKTMIRQIQPYQWGLSIAATGASFWAIGRYDEILHALFATNIEPRATRRSGAISIAIAQFAGFGILTGSLARWRMLADFSLWQATRLTIAVSASFLAGWAVLVILIYWFTSATPESWQVLPKIITVAVGIIVAIYILLPQSAKPSIPLRAALEIIALVFIDLLFATAALYVLLPAGIQIEAITLFSAFLIAFGAGLIGGTPGGVGPFEVVLISLLPTVPLDPMLASILAFRLVYNVLPAAVATLALLSSRLAKKIKSGVVLSRPGTTPHLSSDMLTYFWNSGSPEANLIRQGEFGCLIANRHPLALAACKGQSLVVLGTTFDESTDPSDFLRLIASLAREKRLGGLIYKCPARLAMVARNLGWRVTAIVQEAWLRPAEYSTDGANHRQLRRMLRKAEVAGVRVDEVGRDLPLDEMKNVASVWSKTHNGERGFSMGRYGDDYVTGQRIFVARVNGEMIGYVTFHESRTKWVLDLMRSTPVAPDGTMHLLIHNAIQNAVNCRIEKFSLSAAPHDVTGDNKTIGAMRRYIFSEGNADGLRRFKNSFAPNWTTLYAIAPSRISLAIGIFDVLRAIDEGTSRKNARNST